nr:zinc finger, CCHC-type [Tanacetum cinerariifolium]
MKSSHKAKIADLESGVEKLEEENMSLTKELKSFNTKVESPAFKETVVDKEKSSKQGKKIADIDADAEVNLENMYNLDMAYEETVLSMQDVTDADVSAAPTNITIAQPSEATKATVDITTAPKAKGIAFHDMEESTTRTASSKPQACVFFGAKRMMVHQEWMCLEQQLGINCIFVGYTEHSEAYKFYVIEPNDSISINSIIKSRDAIFDENRFSLIPRPKDIIPNVQVSQMDDHTDDVTNEIPKPRKGFRQKEGIDYFDTYAPVARITTIRLLLALAVIHNLVIHQTDVKTAFLNGDLDEEVYMKQPKGFVMSGNEHKVCKLVMSLYGLKQAPKQWHQKFDEVVLSSGFHLNQFNKYVYSKFDNSDKGVIICLYIDDMLIFGTDQNQVDETKKFLSSIFSMKDMGEAGVILGIKIKRKNKGIPITLSYYIEKILKKFNREDCSPVSTLMNMIEKLKPNTRKPVDQLEHSRAIGCLMIVITQSYYIEKILKKFNREDCSSVSTLMDPVEKLKPNTRKPVDQLEWLLDMNGWVFLLGGGAISWASKKQTCITGSTMESKFVALAAAGKESEWLRNLIHEIPIWPKPIAPISIRCDSAPIMARVYSQIYNGKSRHLALAAAGKESEWLRNLIHEIPIWPKPIAPISIRCDNAPIMARVYSQIYNGKSRHLGVRHSRVRELIRNGVISIEFVRT